MRTFATSILLACLAGLTAAKPVNYTIFAAGVNTQFWDIPINAVGGRFIINRHVNQTCPDAQKNGCTISTHTIIHGDDTINGTLSLGSLCPGGQDTYITKEGLIGFTKAGEKDRLTPNGSIRNPDGFKYAKPSTKWGDLGRVTYSGGNFALCGPEDPVYPSYTLFINTTQFPLPSVGCIPIEVGARYSSIQEQIWAYN